MKAVMKNNDILTMLHRMSQKIQHDETQIYNKMFGRIMQFLRQAHEEHITYCDEDIIDIATNNSSVLSTVRCQLEGYVKQVLFNAETKDKYIIRDEQNNYVMTEKGVNEWNVMSNS